MKCEGRFTQYVLLLHLHHQPGSPPADLHGEIGAAVPGIDLAHRGEIDALDGRLDGRDVLRMVHQRHGLGVGGAIQPGLLDPVALELGVEFGQRRQEALQQLVLREPEELVLRLR